jgi:hypothetical protein
LTLWRALIASALVAMCESAMHYVQQTQTIPYTSDDGHSKEPQLLS